ncbi:MAG: protein-L-isoaspartate O-methyltransferase [Pelistega sp.]|nr:protein-L-isoaspartate O-methyltransferase [Pelistega sp.]
MNAPQSLLDLSRFNMIEQQIRPAGTLNEAVLEAMMGLSRDAFVAPEYQSVAYSDTEIPIKVAGALSNENMLAPRIEARLAQELQLKSTDSVLEIGTGSGFQAALLSRLCRQVKSIEIDSKIAEFATANLAKNHISNVSVEVGDGQNGWSGESYDAILITGSLPSIPDAIKYQLAEGGRLVAIVGKSPVMQLVRITRKSASAFEEESILETCIKPLRGPVTSSFTFQGLDL